MRTTIFYINLIKLAGNDTSVLCWLALVSIYQTDVTSLSEDGRGVKSYVTNPNPIPTLIPNPNSNLKQNNKINPKIINFRSDQGKQCFHNAPFKFL